MFDKKDNDAFVFLFYWLIYLNQGIPIASRYICIIYITSFTTRLHTKFRFQVYKKKLYLFFYENSHIYLD